MFLRHPVIVIRHPKERRSKCTMQPWRWADGFFFYNAQPGTRYDATGHLLLELDAPLLGKTDAAWDPSVWVQSWDHRAQAEGLGERPDFGAFPGRPILLLDATWRRLPQVANCVVGDPIQRSLPDGLRTAYPRVNLEGEDPEGGLATIEALHVALCILHGQPIDVLQHYHWKAAFLAENAGWESAMDSL